MKYLKIFLIILVIVLVLTIIYFNIDYSPLKNEMKSDLKKVPDNGKSHDLLTLEEVAHLPLPIVKYIENSGFIGKPKYKYINLYFKDAKLIKDIENPPLIIDFDQYNFSQTPVRLALVDAKVNGIPFQGYDYIINGKGGMRGVIAKTFTLFHEKGPEMDKAALVTYLSESLLLPSSAINGYINYEEIDDYTVKAKISYNEISAEGVFKFNEDYEIESFTTEDRMMSDGKGNNISIPWTEKFLEYSVTEGGIKYLKHGRAIWDHPDGDIIYFDGVVDRVEFK